jgi:CheY-specific phosphatase CheX
MSADSARLFNKNIAGDVHAAVEKTLGQMFNLPVSSTFEVYEKHSATSGDISGILNLASESLMGSLVVSFPRPTLMKILKELYKRELNEADPAIALGAGEITNIIFGVLKFRLRDKGLTFKMAIPNVVTGQGHKVANSCWTLSGHFKTSVGDFAVLVTQVPETTDE